MQAKITPAPAKSQREVDEVRQIAYSRGGKFTVSSSGAGRHMITITLVVADTDDQQFRSMLYAIEFAVRGQFDRGQHFQGLTQFVLKGRSIDAVVRCLK